jgi:phosphatidate cytidylyltransferase
MEQVAEMPLDAGTERRSVSLAANLLRRAGSAAVALPALLAIVLWGPGWAFAGLVIAVASLAHWEFARMFQRAGQPALPWLGLLAGAGVTASFMAPAAAPFALTGAALVILAAPLWRPAGAPVSWQPGAVSLLAVLYVNWLLGYALPLRALADGVEWVLLVLLVTWLGEAAAYLAGSTLGRRALAPALSPRKTVEGALAQLVVSALAALLARAWFHPGLGTLEALALGGLLGAVGQVGDLAESAIKRSLGTKDTGGLLPGHGGMLDRIDSLLFNVPVLFCYAAWGRALAP